MGFCPLLSELGTEIVKIVDFGVAKIIGRSRKTQAGVVFGTPHYMSPEQGRGNAIDHRTDIYALGVIMYECLKGKVYFYAVRAVNADGQESRDSCKALTQPRVLLKPLVSVLATDKIEVTWNTHPAKDLVGYNVYRGRVAVATNTALKDSWAFNDPPYAEPVVDGVRDITNLQKVNDQPLTSNTFSDGKIELNDKGPESGDYRYAVYAYVVRAVNKLGTESGPSPYALTIPSEPQCVLLRERGRVAEIKWDANPEKGIVGYRIYKYGKPMKLVTKELIKEVTFTDDSAGDHGRYTVVAVDLLGQEGEPSSPVWYGQSYKDFYSGEWHQ